MPSVVHSKTVRGSTSQWSQAKCLLGTDGLGAFGEVGEERKEGRSLGHPSHIGVSGKPPLFVKDSLTYFKSGGEECESQQGAGAEDKRQSQADPALSMEPNAGLDLTILRS